MEPPIGRGYTHRSIFRSPILKRLQDRNSACRGHGFLRQLGCAPPARLGDTQPRLDFYRRTAINSARSPVLEIGAGSGLNLSLYGPPVRRVVGLDPSPQLLSLVKKRSAQAVIPVSLIKASAEDIAFADAASDTIVMT
jgi:SAM-dependent methyltransferase